MKEIDHKLNYLPNIKEIYNDPLSVDDGPCKIPRQ